MATRSLGANRSSVALESPQPEPDRRLTIAVIGIGTFTDSKTIEEH
jgi:hypothetical protein